MSESQNSVNIGCPENSNVSNNNFYISLALFLYHRNFHIRWKNRRLGKSYFFYFTLPILSFVELIHKEHKING